MPNPNPGESEKDFVKRCIPVLVREGKNQDEAIAICYSLYKQNKKGDE